MASWGKKGKEKRRKITQKKGENYTEKGGKGLKKASFLVINSKKFRSPFRRAELQNNQKHNIYPCAVQWKFQTDLLAVLLLINKSY